MSDLTVYKSNALVQASYRLSVNEQRIILNCIGQLNSADEVTDEVLYRVPVLNIAKQAEVDPDSLYKELKAAALRLENRKVRMPVKNKVMSTSWIQTILYSDTDATIEMRFSKDILPYLSELKNQFTKYKLKHVSKMKSSYSIRLYELFVQHKQFGSREIEITWLRNLLDLQDKYHAIKDFKKRVIDIALKDINETSDMWVNYTQRKTGRRITHLRFEFGLKSTSKTKPKRLTQKYIKENANKGETWEVAKKRLSEKMV